MLRRTPLALVAGALLLAACGASETSTSTSTLKDCPRSKAVESVKVKGAIGDAPELDFESPLEITETSCNLLVAGTGTKVQAGVLVTFDFVIVNGRDGSEIASSFGQQPGQIVFDDTLKQRLPGLHAALSGLAEGSRVLLAMTPADGPFQGSPDPEAGVEVDDSLLMIIDLQKVESPDDESPTGTDQPPALTRAEGVAVEPVDGLPTVVLADDGTPTITVPEGAPPAELVAQPLIQGEGDAVEAGQTITVHYSGVLWDTGEPFDSSWTNGSPASFPIGTGAVIAGWDKGLVGQTIGSQILLVIPGEDAYPDGRPGIPAGATLVFVVDILGASA